MIKARRYKINPDHSLVEDPHGPWIIVGDVEELEAENTWLHEVIAIQGERLRNFESLDDEIEFYRGENSMLLNCVTRDRDCACSYCLGRKDARAKRKAVPGGTP